LRRTDTRQCDSCHGSGPHDFVARRPNYDGIDVSDPTSLNIANLTWGSAVDHDIDGIIVSNHGGRVVDSSRATIEVLPEVIEAVGSRVPVLVDSGFRRRTDIIKALTLGARGVCIGRPYLWGLAAFGQPGVERVLEILRAETRAAMQQVGAPAIKDLTPAMVQRA
jgi:isopentenyl diphosphate isomerase/L-lactate dehydrogenase-like FMN-dependent dehydrogenase